MGSATDVAVEFRRTGIVRLDGAFGADEAAEMRETFWRHVHGQGDIRRDDPSTWPVGRGSLGFKKVRRSAAFRPFHENETVRHALDTIFAETGWTRPQPGAQVLHTFPVGGPWVLPAGGWHIDCGFERPSWPVHAVKLFGFFGPVAPAGGGTLLLSGSHRLVDRYRESIPDATPGNTQTWRQFMTHHPALRDIYRGGTVGAPGREVLGREYDVDGIPVKAIELCGRPGDVVITHLHTFHCVAPNTGARPRLMLGKAVSAAA